MSRIISHSNIQWTGIPIEYLGTIGSFGGNVQNGGFTSTSNPASYSLTNSSSDTYSKFTPATGGEGSSRWGFGISGIPDNAIINSITCQIKVACSNGYGFSTARAQFFCGDTAKGTALDFTNSSSTTVRSYTNCGSWTREELDSLELRITSKKSVSSNGYVNFYGADLTITYSYDETQYEVTASSQSASVTVSPASQYVTEGDNATVTFNNVSDITEINVKDNDVSVTGNLVNTSGTTYTYTIEDINADHSITVQDVPSVYVTVVNNSTNVSSIVPTSGTTVKVGQGSNVDIKIYTNEINHIDIFDNDVKNNNATLEREIVDTTTTCIPGSYSENTFGTFASPGNGYADTTSTTRVICQPGSTSTTQSVYFNFDVSSIPNDAVIHSVSCKVKICVSNSFSNTDTGIQLYSGTTSKSSRNYFGWYTNTTANVYTLSNVGTFTRAELDNARLKITGRTSRTGRSIYFYGAELIVDYEYAGDTYYLYTTFGTTTKTVRFEDKVQYNITSISNLNGSSITPSSISVYEGESYTVVINTSNIIAVVLYDNNVNVTSNIINDNGTYKYVISNISIDHSLRIEEFTNYTLTATSNFNQVTITPSSIKIYDGQSASFTITAQDNHYKLFDNDTDVTSNIVSNIYTINNVHEIHTLIIEEETKYEITAVGYQNTTISPSSTYVYEGESIIFTISNFNNNFYLFDNNINVTSSLQSQGNLTHTYEINNIHETHSIRIESKPKYSITVTQYNKITGTPSSTQVYEGESITITLNNFNSNFYIFDNNVNVTSSVVSNTYTINNVHEIHNIRFEEIPRYNITLINNVGGGISLTAQPYSYIIEGESSTIEIVGSITSNLSYFIEQYSVLDNRIDIASQFTQVTGSGHYPKIQYILNNIITDHTIILQRKTLPLYIKINGQYTAISKIYQISSGIWIEYTQTDYTQLFESDKIYIKKDE